MRYLPLTQIDRQDMLATIGVASVDDLFVDVPHAAHRAENLDLPRHQSEMQVERQLAAMANKNTSASQVPFFCGAPRTRKWRSGGPGKSSSATS